jgi:pimeloyl-ACP methyl ester carboxylesterase
MDQANKRNVLFLPGGIQPAALQYAPLLKVLGASIQPLLKDLEVYREDTPPADYSLTAEIDGVKHAVDEAGMQTFHLVGYSGGGAVALAFTGIYPERVLSLALSEPAVIPSQEWYQQESAYWQQMTQVMSLPDNLLMQEFMRMELREGVPLPPPPPAGDPPPWMAKRPAGLKALSTAFSRFDLPYSRLRGYSKPVYLAVAALSTQVEMRKGEVLWGLFPDLQVEVYENRHHFDPPQRVEPERFAQALVALWKKAGSH